MAEHRVGSRDWSFTMVFMRPVFHTVKANPLRASASKLALPLVLEYTVMPGIVSGTDFQASPLTNTGR